ncbi:MAG: efflux RND transporter periplasmic adaptor subunit [Janthinobacterium lividum]
MSERAAGNGRKIAIQVAIACVVLALSVVGIRSATRSDIEIRAAKVEYGDLLSSIATNGKVEPMQNFQAHAGEPGTVKAVYVHSGETVQAGTLILRLDAAAADARVQTARSAIAQAQAAQFDIRQGGTADERIGINGDLSRAKLQLQQAQNDVNALEALQAKGAAAANEVAAARQRLASAQTSLQSVQQRATERYATTDRQRVQAQLADSQAALAAAQDTLANSVVRAPFSGTVYSLPVKQYDFVPAGEELVQMADLTKVQVRAYFDEPEIGKLSVGAAVLIKWDAKPNQVWHGHITRVPTTVITYGTRNVGEALIAVDDAASDLLPNTNVNVNVTTQQIYHVLSLPREALHTEGSDSNFVYLIQKGVLSKRKVQIGALNLMRVQIKSGLNSGDLVALNPLSSSVDLTDGLRVKVVPQ